MKNPRPHKSQTQFELMIIVFLAFLLSLSFGSMFPKPMDQSAEMDDVVTELP